MKTMTLVARHLYFGMDPLQLRDAANRVLSRVPEDTSASAAVKLDALIEDLHLTPSASKAIIEEMVQSGVLTKLPPSVGAAYGLTPRFREIARARIIEPLERVQAQLLVAHCAEVAGKFNRSANRNKYEIEAVAVFGHYMTRNKAIAELELGITGRRRSPDHIKTFIGRATAPTEGTSEIRALFEQQSGFIDVSFFKKLEAVPRPFSVIYKAD
jgi:hypothetical protein